MSANDGCRMRNDRLKRALVVAAILLLFLFAACLFTRPLISQGAGSTYKDPYDPTFQAWTLSWDLHQLARNPGGLFDANIFFPNDLTLAYSDFQLTNAFLSLPFQLLTGNPVQAANLTLILNFFLSAVGAYLLTARLTRSRMAGVVAGLAFSFAPARLAHMGHLQLSGAAWIPLCLLFLHRYCESRRPYDAALCALFLVVQTLATWYYGIILTVAILVFLAVRLAMGRRQFTLKWTATLLACFLAAGLLILPFAWPYLKLNRSDPSFERTIEEVHLFSADVRDFAIAPEENLLWGRLTADLRETTTTRGGPTERSLFPGLLPLVLGVFGAFLLVRKGRGEERFYGVFYAVLALFAALLCLGGALYFFGHRLDVPMPYDALFRFFPGFRVMRVPARFVVLISLSFAVLSGFAVREILKRARARKTAAAVVVAVALAALLFVDLMSASLPMYAVPKKEEFPPVYHWLEAREGTSPSVELPLADYNPSTFKRGLTYEATWIAREAMRTYYSTLHFKKIFNGYSGYIPASYYRGVLYGRSFPSEESIAFFADQGLEFIIVHEKELPPSTVEAVRGWAKSHDDIVEVKRFDGDVVYSISANEPARP